MISNTPQEYDGFILSRMIKRQQGKSVLIYQGRLSDGRQFRWTVTKPRICFFIPRSSTFTFPNSMRREISLRGFRGEPVDALYFNTPFELQKARDAIEREGFPHYEADISALDRHLMERFVMASVHFISAPVRKETDVLHWENADVSTSDFTPELQLLSFDIECSMQGQLFSIAISCSGLRITLMLDPEKSNEAQIKLLMNEGLSSWNAAFITGDSTRISDGIFETYLACKDEKEVLLCFFRCVSVINPDVLIGWNVIGFDLRFLAKKSQELGLAFDIGIGGPAELIEPIKGDGRVTSQWLARIPGRSVLDGINLLKAAFITLDDYSLSTAAHELLGQEKLIELTGKEKVKEIERQFREDKRSLAKYNLQDADLVLQIFKLKALAQFAVRKSQLTGLSLDRVGGSTAAFDFLYLPRLHRRGFVADTVSRASTSQSAPGGMVFEGVPGFFSWVAILDFKSLYPSIIRTFSIDPLAAQVVEHSLEKILNSELISNTQESHVQENISQSSISQESKSKKIVNPPLGLSFDPDYAILPEIIGHLWAERDRAKQMKDASLSQAVKIIMNSFYGVLGSGGCRFFDSRLAGTITRNGHWLLLKSKKYIEDQGFRVLYGDTDSLFVELIPMPVAKSSVNISKTEINKSNHQAMAKESGKKLVSGLNQYLSEMILNEFSVKSYVEIQFDKLFHKFFMPTLRGDDRGSKKRYAGLLENQSLYFSGMESSRSDWTLLAKQFQEVLFNCAFSFDEHSAQEELSKLVLSWHQQLFNGKFDLLLEYRKGLSKPLSEYTQNVPPHVKAARQLDELDGRIIRYVISRDGPEPIQKRSNSPFDYDHYAEKQLAPIADTILHNYDTDYDLITKPPTQMSLF